MLCPKCSIHYCLAHRHHGCLDELPSKEAKKAVREAAKKSKEQFEITKREADKKVRKVMFFSYDHKFLHFVNRLKLV